MRKIIQIGELVGGLLVAVLFGVVLLQVVARVILQVPTSWTVELGRVLFVAIVFLGSITLVYTNGHMVINTLLEFLPPRMRRVIELFTNVLIILLLGAFSFGALEKTVSNWKIVIPTLEWMTNGYMYLIVLIGGVGMLVCSIIIFVHKLRRAA
jgi:TRAP-type C4-dicarboxylate transport system permease small subunit